MIPNLPSPDTLGRFVFIRLYPTCYTASFSRLYTFPTHSQYVQRAGLRFVSTYKAYTPHRNLAVGKTEVSFVALRTTIKDRSSFIGNGDAQ